MFRLGKAALITMLFWVSVLSVLAQNYPVHVNQQLQFPRPVYFPEYYGVRNPWQITVELKDQHEMMREVYITLQVHHASLQIETKDHFAQGKFMLYPNTPYVLSASEMGNLLSASSVHISGAGAPSFINNGILPEGQYSFCVKVIDVLSGEQLSATECENIWIKYCDPPRVVAPICGHVIDPQIPADIFFQWQSYTAGFPSLSLNSEYELFLYEITDPNADPSTALINGKVRQVFHTGGLQVMSYHYSLADPPLTIGRKYIWLVKHTDITGHIPVNNDGFSQVCWFSYGYPEGGQIQLNFPPDSHVFRSNDIKTFSWSVPDNLMQSQQYQFVFRYGKGTVKNGKPEFAKGNKIDSIISPPQVQNSGWGETLNRKLDVDETYCWRVYAKSGSQIIAESKTRIFRGPPLIESFFAGNKQVKVLKTFNKNLSNLQGIGSIVKNAHGDTIIFRFDSLKIIPVAGRYVLQGGAETIGTRWDSIKLKPKHSWNNEGSFLIKSYRIDSKGLYARGTFGTVMPFLTTSSLFQCVSDWFDYNTYSINTYAKSQKAFSYPLMDPKNFEVVVEGGSKVVITNNRYNLNLTGFVVLSKLMPELEGVPPKLPFKDQPQLVYFRDSTHYVFNRPVVTPNQLIFLKPEIYVLDFSDAITHPGSSTPFWKGLILEKFKLQIDLGKDDSRQFKANNELSFQADTSALAVVDSRGLILEVKSAFGEVDSLLFNSFRSNPDSIILSAQYGVIQRSYFRGRIQIPFLEGGKYFNYVAPLYSSGFGEAYMLEAFNNYKINWNPNKQSQKMEITLKRGVFKEHNRLVFTAKYNWPGIDADLGLIDGLSVWGNNNVGFWIPNGIASLPKAVSAKFGEFDAQVSFLGAGRDGNIYAFGTTGEMKLADNISGPDGAPKANAFSIIASQWIPDTHNQQADTSNNTLGPFNSGSGGIGTFKTNNTGLNELVVSSFRMSGFNTDSIPYHQQDPRIPFPDPKSQLTLQDIKNLLKLLALFTTGEQQQQVSKIYTYIDQLDQDEVREIYSGLYDIKGLLAKLLEQQVSLLSAQLKQQIKNEVGKLQSHISSSIHAVIDTVYYKVDRLVAEGFESMTQNLVSQIDNDQAKEIVTTIIKDTRKSIMGELRRSLIAAVDSNITNKINEFIDEVLTHNALIFVDRETYKLGSAILSKNNESARLIDSFKADCSKVVKEAAGAIKDRFNEVNLPSITNTLVQTGEDMYNGFDWKNVAADLYKRLAASLLGDSLKNVLKTLIENNAGNLASGIYGGIAENVHLDFNNLGSKLKEGDLKDIVKFDPTYIIVKTKAVDVEGYLKFTSGDPVYGDSWQGSLAANVKKPSRFSAKAKFLNGKKNDFTYWYTEVAVPSNLNAPVIPSVLLLDGVGGRFYHHMSSLNRNKYVPTDTVDVGFGLDAYFIDQPSAGKTLVLDMTAQATFYSSGYTIGILGDVDVGNNGNLPVITGNGYITFNSANSGVLGRFNVHTNTAPLLCAKGELGVEFKPDWWEIYVGKKESPVHGSVLCSNFATQDIWFQLNKKMLDLGIRSQTHLKLATPWIDFGARDIKAFAKAGFDFEANVHLDFQPKFKLANAYVGADVYAAVGCDWKTKTKTGTWNLAAVNFGGNLLYESDPGATISGTMYGTVSILNVDVDLDMKIKQQLN